jgi:hypothetical protein
LICNLASTKKIFSWLISEKIYNAPIPSDPTSDEKSRCKVGKEKNDKFLGLTRAHPDGKMGGGKRATYITAIVIIIITL